MSSNMCPVFCGHWAFYGIQMVLSVCSKFTELKTHPKAGRGYFMGLLMCMFESPGTRDDKLHSESSLKQHKQRTTYYFGLHTLPPPQKNHKWQPAKGSNYALKTKTIQFQQNFLVPRWLPLLWLIIQGGALVAGDRWRFGCFGGTFFFFFWRGAGGLE